MNLTVRQQFGLCAAVMRQPSLLNESQIAKCFLFPKAVFSDLRARWLAREIVFEVEGDFAAHAIAEHQEWYPKFIAEAKADPAAYSLPACLVTTH